jgi:FMN phosphatase YigB (HAD superfamily)
VLFVDDWPTHVRVAIKLGFQGVLMQRRWPKERSADLDVVRDLNGVEQMINRG